MADVDVIPGLFKLGLPITDKNINQDTVNRKLLDIEQDLRTRLDRPEELAILNLLGLLKFALKRYDESQEHFRTVLEKDPDNLNALADMQHVLLALRMKKDARCFQDKWEDLIGQDTKQKRIIKARARCLAEQAYVYAVDMHTDGDCDKRYKQSNDIFRKALQCAGEMVDTSEKDFWEFFIAKNLHKLFTKLIYSDNYTKADEYMESVVSLFFKIANRNPGDPEYRWESWRHLADVVRTIKSKKHFTYGHLQPQMLRDCFNDPEMCMKQAMEISSDNPRFLARYANFVYSLRRENCYKDALELLHNSICLDDSDYNFYAFSTRGMIYIKSYQWQLRKYNKVGGAYFQPHPNMLEKARADLEKAVKFRNTAWDLLHLATVYHHLAKCDTVVSPEEQRQYLELELHTLKRCEDCGDHSDRQRLQQTFGRCFFDLGEYRESIDCFKEAMLLESPGAQYTGYFQSMFCSYLSLLQSEYKDENARPILEEMVQSMRKAMTKYGSGSLTRYCFTVNLHKEYDQELQMLYNYCEKIEDNLAILALLRPTELSSQFAPVGRGGTLKQTWEKPIPKLTLDKLARESRTHPSDAVTKRDAGCARGLACALVSGSDTMGEGKGSGTLVSGIRGTKVRNSSGQEPPGNRRDVKLAASLFEGSDTLKEDEGIAPLVSGIEGLGFRDPSGQIVQKPGIYPQPTSPLTPPTRQGGTLDNLWTNPIQPHQLKASRKVNLTGQVEALSETPERRGNRNDVGTTASACALVEGSDTQEENEGIAPLMSGFRGMEIRAPSGLEVQEPRGQSQPAVESPSGTLSPDKDHKFLYDFYVMHGDSDEKWVNDTLFHELETVRELKGCTYKNDAAPGSYMFEGKLELMKQCACILVLLREDGQYFVQQTLKLKMEYGLTVIPIEKDGSKVPDELSVMKSFDASAAGRVKWDKLAQSIKNTKGAPSYA